MSEEKFYYSFGVKLYKKDNKLFRNKIYFEDYLNAQGVEFEKNLENKEKDTTWLKLKFENEIKKEVYRFINKKFDNIVLFAGAGASVVKDDKDVIDSNYGKTVAMIAKDIYKKLNDEKNRRIYIVWKNWQTKLIIII